MEASRRASLHGRLVKQDEERVEAEAELEKETLQTTEDFESKREDWIDVQQYVQQQRLEHRQGIAGRVAKGREEKEVMLRLHQEKLDTMHEELMNKRMDAEDVVVYKANEKKRRRESVARRLDSWKLQKMKAAKQSMKQKMSQLEEFSWKQKDWEALQTAKVLMKENRLQDILKHKTWM